MNGRSFKMLMDTLRRARRIDGMMPQLPPDLTNGRTRVLDTLYELGGYAKEDASRRRAVRVRLILLPRTVPGAVFLYAAKA